MQSTWPAANNKAMDMLVNAVMLSLLDSFLCLS